MSRFGQRTVDARRCDFEDERSRQLIGQRRGVEQIGGDPTDIGDEIEVDSTIAIDHDADHMATTSLLHLDGLEVDSELMERLAQSGHDGLGGCSHVILLSILLSSCGFFQASRVSGTVLITCHSLYMLGPLPVPHLTRRQGFTALAVLGPVGLLAACSSAEPGPTTPTEAPATVASAVAAQEQELVALYSAVMTAYPVLAPSIAAIADQHRQHAASLDAETEPSPTPSSSEIPDSQEKALVALVSAERKATRQRVEACVEAADAGLARTLAFIAASESSHVPALRDLRS
jgi:hypothetical protein